MSSIAKIVVEGLKIIDPTVKGVDLIQALAEYVNERNIKKIDEINERLLNDEATEYEKQKILSGGVDEEDYLSFIKAAVNEDEVKKTTHYITLYRNILNGKVVEGKGRLYKILKDIPYSAVELLPKIYVHKNCNVQNKTLDNYIAEIAGNEDLAFEVNLLLQYGLLKNIQLSGGLVPSNSNIQISSSFDSIVELFFKKEELTPHSQGIKVWIKKAYIFTDLNHLDDLNYIEELLISTAIKPLNNNNILTLNKFIPIHTDIIVCILNDKTIPQASIDVLKKYSKIYKIYKVCINNDVNDQLEEIEGELIKIKKGVKEDEFHFLSNFDVHPMDFFSDSN